MQRPGAGKLLTDAKEGGILIWLNSLERIYTRATAEMLQHECNRILARRYLDPDTDPP